MTAPPHDPADPFTADGEMASLCRSVDWAATPLGPVEGWPGTLRSVVRACLEAPFPICLWCGDDLVLVYNDGYRDVLGPRHPDALARPGPEAWSDIWDDIAPLFDRIREGGEAVYHEDAPFLLERSSDGGSGGHQPNAWFTFSLSPVRDARGEIAGFLNIVSESTRRVLAEREGNAARARAERAEARLLEVFEQAPAFMAVLRGPDHVVEYANRAYYKVVGERELIGLPVMEALPEVRGQGFQDLLDRVLETGEAYVGREVSVQLARTPGGEAEERFVDFVYYPITETDGTRSGVVAHGSDVTAHVRARRDAQAARGEAEEANRAKSRFLANMSHELRTPINAIVGYAELLELEIPGPLTDEQRMHLRRVRSSSGHLLTLVDDVLDLARVEAGRMEVAHERVAVTETVAAALALISPQADGRGLRIENRCGDDATTSYVGDPDRVRQILVNLLSNAVKFTPSGGEIRIECGISEEPAGERGSSGPGRRTTWISVTDTGIGIDADEMEEIFRPFTQADAADDSVGGGTGLGLSISQQLASLMGGSLTARSEPGKGSTFTLRLPGEGTPPPPIEDEIHERAATQASSDLAAVGEALMGRIPEVLERFVTRLREDARVPNATGMAAPDLANHTSSFLADIAHSLVLLEHGLAPPERRLQDGSEIQRMVAELHGRQRARYGWEPEALEREWTVLGEAIAEGVREALPGHDLEGPLGLVGRLLERAAAISMRHLRQTRAADGAVRRARETGG